MAGRGRDAVQHGLAGAAEAYEAGGRSWGAPVAGRPDRRRRDRPRLPRHVPRLGGGGTIFPTAIATAALAHTNDDKTEAAYARGDLFAKRAELMTAWADYWLTAKARVALRQKDKTTKRVFVAM